MTSKLMNPRVMVECVKCHHLTNSWYHKCLYCGKSWRRKGKQKEARFYPESRPGRKEKT